MKKSKEKNEKEKQIKQKLVKKKLNIIYNAFPRKFA